MQRSQRFVADQRFDLPQYDSMISLISAEFAAYNKAFFAPQNRIVKNWKVNNNGGLQVAVDQTSDSTLFNSKRAGKEQFILRGQTDTLLTLLLADNATNYVEVQIITGTCASDTVAIWDTTANGGIGQEFTQNVDTNTEERPQLVSNTIAFTGDTDKIPLAIVVTAGGAITSITDSRKFLFNVEADWNFGSARTDKTISNQKEAYDALATAIKEIKGTPAWYTTPYASAKTLKEYQNTFFYGGGTLSWSGTDLSFSAAFQMEIAGRTSVYQVDAGTFTFNDGDVMYIDIPPGVPSGSIVPVVMPLSAVPLHPGDTNYSPYIQTIFFRRGNLLFGGSLEMPDLEPGESVVLGESIASSIAGRLGIINDASYIPYNNTNYIGTNDSYPVAISKVDQALSNLAASVAAISSDVAHEEDVVLGADGTVVTASTLTWNASNTIVDIQVYRNGQKVSQAKTGLAADGDFKKTANNQLTFFDTLTAHSRITIRDERTGGGGANDLTNIPVDIQPTASGAKSLGTTAKAWNAMYLKDQSSAQVYKISIIGGVLNIAPVP